MNPIQLTSRGQEVKHRRALGEMKVGLFSCVALGPPARRCIIGEVRTNEGIQEVELCCTFVGVDSRWVMDVVLQFERVDP